MTSTQSIVAKLGNFKPCARAPQKAADSLENERSGLVAHPRATSTLGVGVQDHVDAALRYLVLAAPHDRPRDVRGEGALGALDFPLASYEPGTAGATDLDVNLERRNCHRRTGGASPEWARSGRACHPRRPGTSRAGRPGSGNSRCSSGPRRRSVRARRSLGFIGSVGHEPENSACSSVEPYPEPLFPFRPFLASFTAPITRSFLTPHALQRAVTTAPGTG
jgi:hypothetical protein